MENFPPFQAGLPFCEAATRGFLNLAIGETQFGMSPQSKKALIQAAARGSLYPDSSTRALTEKIAAHYRIQPDMVFVGNGTDEIILCCAMVFLEPAAKCLMSQPTFPGFESSVKMVRAEPLYSPLREMRVDVQGLADLLPTRPKLWFLCNPHNPTGTVVNHSEQRQLIELAYRNGVVTVVDEAYAEYASPELFQSAVTFIDRYPNVILTRTFSKAYGLAGLRCGYAMGNKDLIAELKKTRHAVPFNVNRIALEVGCAALEDQKFVRDCYLKTEAAKNYFYNRLRDMGLSYIPSSTNFVLVQFDCDADVLCEELKKRYRILVRSGKAFGFPQWIRISLGTLEQMQYVAQCLEAEIMVYRK